MGKIIKIIPIILMVLGAVFAQLMVFSGHSLAAPGALPPCGNDNLPGVNDSSWPDIATSKDANRQYTAVAWSEGTNGIGAIKLAWSEAVTTTRTWRLLTVDNISDGQNPVIVFDPVTTKKVHVAYQKGITYNTIYYNTSTLGNTDAGTCNATPVPVSGNMITGRQRPNPAIANNSSGHPKMLY